MEGWRLGLLLGLAAFLAGIVAPLAPAVGLLFMVLAVACVAVLQRDAARSRAAAARQGTTLALGLAGVGFVALLAAGTLAARGAAQGMAGIDPAAVWLQAAAEVAIGGAFYLGVVHFAADRSRTMLALALGASVAVTLAVALAAVRGSDLLASALLAKGLPFILFAWAYATILGRLRRAGGPEAEARGSGSA